MKVDLAASVVLSQPNEANGLYSVAAGPALLGKSRALWWRLGNWSRSRARGERDRGERDLAELLTRDCAVTRNAVTYWKKVDMQ